MADETLRKRMEFYGGKINDAVSDLNTAILNEDLVEVRVIFTQVESHEKAVEHANNQLMSLTMSNEDMINDIESYEQIRKIIFTLKIKSQDFIHLKSPSLTTHSNPSSNHSNSYSSNHSLKLPKLHLQKFLGDFEEYQGWYDTFNASVHDNNSLGDIEKFNYLKSLLGGRALEAIQGLNLSSSNYHEALDIIKNRFGRPQLLVKTHMQKLIALTPLSNKADLDEMRFIYKEFDVRTRSLATLGVNSNLYDALLTPLLESKLSPSLLLAFERLNSNADSITLSPLLKFLGQEVARQEAIAFTRPDLQNKPVKDIKTSRGSGPYKSSVAALHSASTASEPLVKSFAKLQCIFCNEAHASYKCPKGQLLSLAERKDIITKSKVCFKCLNSKNHFARFCKFKIVCRKCKGHHQTLLCEKNFDSEPKVDQTGKDIAVAHSSTEDKCANDGSSSGSCLQTAMASVMSETKKATIRVLFDSGSQCSFIRSGISKSLGLKVISREDLNISGFGGARQTKVGVRKVEVLVKGLSESDSVTKIHAFELDDLCSPINVGASQSYIKEFECQGISVQYNSDNGPQEIGLLVGSDYYWKFVTGKVVRSKKSDIVAIESSLGWMLNGGVHNGREANSLFLKLEEPISLDNQLKSFWELEAIGISSLQESANGNASIPILEEFANNITFENGSYVVGLPWKSESCKPSTNWQLSQKRLDSALKRLQRNPKSLMEYDGVMKGYLQEGYSELVEDRPDVINHMVHYLPHQGVLRQDKDTTKLRVVFDGSAKEQNNYSLNDCLETGPNLNANLFALLLRFRVGKIAITADIKQAFLRIGLKPDDRDFVRYLWIHPQDLEKENPRIQTYRMKSVLFGLSSSPFLLAATIRYHLNQCRVDYPCTVGLLDGNFYVDDLLVSVDELHLASKLFMEAKEIMGKANMELRKWQSNDKDLQQIMADSKVVYPVSEHKLVLSAESKVLGIVWEKSNDCFMFNAEPLIDLYLQERLWTKRSVLRLTSKIFDPIGYLAPFVIRTKILFQSLWESGIGWDEKLPIQFIDKYQHWFAELVDLKDILIPRWYFGELAITPKENNLSLHIFCDASQDAYATCIYLRGESNGMVSCKLVGSKTRVAPLKTLSIPRLELMGAIIACRLNITVREALNRPGISCYFWTDSTIVLQWIRGPSKKWKQFVSNRVEEIQGCSDPSHWHHCPGIQNPADLATRGISTTELAKSSLWWNGPEWLHSNLENWPLLKDVPLDSCMDPEVSNELKICVNLIHIEHREPLLILENFSTLKRVLRVSAWVLRFLNNTKGGVISGKVSQSYLTSEEVHTATKYWIVYVQEEAFNLEKSLLASKSCIPKDSNLKNLDIFLENNILRVGGRLQFSDLLVDQKHQILLPSNHRFVDLLIMETHFRLLHCGVRDVVVELRQCYWIPKIRQVVKKVLSGCLICKRWNSKPFCEKVAPLPKERCSFSSPFDVVGVDFAGPVYVYDEQDLKKGYICLFTCSTTRAIHLELVSSLSTDHFLLAFKRFVARRGFPSIIISDNAKTFKRAAKELQEVWEILNNSQFQEYFSYNKVKWQFIVERAPWWGGFWERLVRSVKTPLKKVLANSRLSSEEFSTVLCGVEAMINSRPITYVYNELKDAEPLTPSHFICGKRLTTCPYAPVESVPLEVSPEDMTKRLRYVEALQDQLWIRWQKEYLPELNRYAQHGRQNFSVKIRVGDVVLIDNEGPRQTWKIAIVEEVFIGKDGCIRAASVKTGGTKLKRPIQKLYSLEINGHKENEALVSEVDDPAVPVAHSDDGVENNCPSVGCVRKSRRGRPIVIPQRYVD